MRCLLLPYQSAPAGEADDRRSTMVTSQLPVDAWHDSLDHPTLADAILDRLVHNAYRLELRGESMRRKRALVSHDTPPENSP